jgi:hypothetical protein
MRDGRRWGSKLVAALLGATLGASAFLLLGDIGAPPRSRPPAAVRPSPLPTIEPLSREPDGGVLLAWTPGSLPPSGERFVEKVPGVVDATTVQASLDWITETRDRAGSVVDAPPDDFAIPFEVAVVDPVGYAAFVAPGERDLIGSLSPGELVLSRTAADLRHGGEGLQLDLRAGTARVTGVVSDEAAQGYEALMAAPVPESWRRADRFLLIRVAELTARDRVDRRLRALLGGSEPLRVRAFGETPFLRYGDAVLPQMMIKEAFGEFAARPVAGGAIQIDPAWQRDNIVTVSVPLIGRVTCHRFLVAQLRDALQAARAAGVGSEIDPAQFAGCYNARFIGRDPDARLSHHSWGIAVDFNALENPTGVRPRLDRDVVEIVERHGFTWGGRWLVPDGMHFEWVRFP